MLKPVIKDPLWGAHGLKPSSALKPTRKSPPGGWMLSCYKDGTNTVINGIFSGKPIDEVMNVGEN